MAAAAELEHLGKPPEDAIFCLLCRGTISLPDVNYLLRIANSKISSDMYELLILKISTAVKLKLFLVVRHSWNM